MNSTKSAQSGQGKPVELDRIDFEASPQARESIHDETVAEYAAAMKAGEPFPPVELVELDDGRLLIGDGGHRYRATQHAGHKTIEANIQKGDVHLAVRIAAGANRDHGRRRTNGDKRAAVRLLLNDEKWVTKSDRWIADAAGVSNHLVAGVKDQLGILPVEKREGLDGKRRRVPKKKAVQPPSEPVATLTIDPNRESRGCPLTSVAADGPLTVGSRAGPLTNISRAGRFTPGSRGGRTKSNKRKVPTPDAQPTPDAADEQPADDHREQPDDRTCPNCGCCETDADGDCAQCKRPDIGTPTVEDDPLLVVEQEDRVAPEHDDQSNDTANAEPEDTGPSGGEEYMARMIEAVHLAAEYLSPIVVVETLERLIEEIRGDGE